MPNAFVGLYESQIVFFWYWGSQSGNGSFSCIRRKRNLGYIFTRVPRAMGAGLDAVSYCAFSHIAVLIAYRVFIVWRLAAVAEAKLARTQSEAKVFVPSVAAPLPVLIGLKVTFIRWAATAVATAFGE
jgi:hypothetical protein